MINIYIVMGGEEGIFDQVENQQEAEKVINQAKKEGITGLYYEWVSNYWVKAPCMN